MLDVAWGLVREEGTEALTLGRLAEQAGVTKPVVYDHFSTIPGLLAALYQEFDARQTALMDAALQTSEPTLLETATVIASSYVDCVLLQGNEIPGVIAALASSPELEKIKREYEAIFMNKCRMALSPFTKEGARCSRGPVPCSRNRRNHTRAGAGRTLRNDHRNGRQKRARWHAKCRRGRRTERLVSRNAKQQLAHESIRRPRKESL